MPPCQPRGTWSCDGWSATEWLDGREAGGADPETWLGVIDAGRAFHRAVTHLPRPRCLGYRDDRWAVADRFAWGEQDVDLRPELAALGQRLGRALEPLGVPAVARALLFRLATTSLPAAAGISVDVADKARRYTSAATAVGI